MRAVGRTQTQARLGEVFKLSWWRSASAGQWPGSCGGRSGGARSRYRFYGMDLYPHCRLHSHRNLFIYRRFSRAQNILSRLSQERRQLVRGRRPSTAPPSGRSRISAAA